MAKVGAKPGGKPAKKNDGPSKGMIEYVLKNPISCGSLLVFCDIEHNAENLNFIMDVYDFKDKYADKQLWRGKDWMALDKELKVDKKTESTKSKHKTNVVAHLLDEGDGGEPWPSKTVNRRAMLLEIQTIWENYISDDSATQICLSKEVLNKTRFRIDNLHLYGTEVFGECLQDPIKTTNRDILPRYMKSDLYKNLNVLLSHADPLPPATALALPLPPTKMIDNDSFLAGLDSYSFKIEDMYQDRFCFETYRSYLAPEQKDRHLMCMRMINVFDVHIAAKDQVSANAQAWEIYKFFVAPSSAYDVGCDHFVQKKVAHRLCKSAAGDFDKVKKFLHDILVSKFAAFLTSPQHGELKPLQRLRRQQRDSRSKFPMSLLGKTDFDRVDVWRTPQPKK